MANLKDVSIEGVLPFDCDNDAEMCWVIGKLSGPVTDVRIFWNGEAPAVPNKHGGKTAMYKFRISGQEAVADAFLNRVLAAIINCGGKLITATARDLENNGPRYKLGQKLEV